MREHPVAVLSAAVLRHARMEYRESQLDFAKRAGVAPDMLAAVENAARPAWSLPHAEFTALAEALSVLNPWMHGMFATAAACDLLLSQILDGERTFATDVLADPDSRELALLLMRWALAGEIRHPQRAAHVRTPNGGLTIIRCAVGGQEGWRHDGALFCDDHLTLLRDRARTLATSASPDAWVGVEILAAGWGELA